MRKRALGKVEPDEHFNTFWQAFPRRVAKADALKAWGQLQPNTELVEEILEALEWQKRQPGWVKDGGAFVPYPASWLRGRRWEDEPFSTISPVGRRKKVPDDEPL